MSVFPLLLLPACLRVSEGSEDKNSNPISRPRHSSAIRLDRHGLDRCLERGVFWRAARRSAVADAVAAAPTLAPESNPQYRIFALEPRENGDRLGTDNSSSHPNQTIQTIQTKQPTRTLLRELSLISSRQGTRDHDRALLLLPPLPPSIISTQSAAPHVLPVA